jgi:hypothetical protein
MLDGVPLRRLAETQVEDEDGKRKRHTPRPYLLDLLFGIHTEV